MANEILVRVVSKKAAADLSSYQFCAVRISASGTVNVCNGYLYRPTGVLRNKPTVAGYAAEVQRSGEGPVLLAGAVSAGDLLSPNATGAWYKTIAGHKAYAEAQESGASGEIIAAAIFCEGGGESVISTLSP